MDEQRSSFITPDSQQPTLSAFHLQITHRTTIMNYELSIMNEKVVPLHRFLNL